MEYKYTFRKKQIKYVEQSIAISKIRAGYAIRMVSNLFLITNQMQTSVWKLLEGCFYC